MKKLFEAFQNALAGTPLAALIGTRLYLDSAPMGASLPYVVLLPVSAPAQDTFTGRIARLWLQADCYATTASSCWAIEAALEDFLLETSFDTGESKPLRISRLSEGFPRKGGEEYWRASPEFRAYV